MSNVWKKLAQTFHSSKTGTERSLVHDASYSTESFNKFQRLFSITPDDEAILSNYGKDVGGGHDPLAISSQFAQNLNEVLSQKSMAPSSYTFFSEYLESKDLDFLLLFLEEVEKFEHLFILLNGEANLKINDSPQKQAKSRPILPDLVSNIPKNVVVTPHHSPENEVFSFMQQVEEDSNINISDKTSSPPLDALSSPLPTESSSNALLNDVSCILNVAFYIFDKYINNQAENSVGNSNPVRTSIEEKLNKRKADSNLFYGAKDEVLSILERYYSKYIESQYFLKHEIEVLTGESVILQDVLRSESALPYFMEYLEQEGSQSLLEFWISVSNFREHLHSNKYKNPEQSQADAMILYDKYFSLQARSPLGFSDEVRFKVENNICHEEGPLLDCFDAPLRIVLHILQRDFLRGYLSSSLHMNLLRELVNKVKVNNRHSRNQSASLSNEGSEQSCSTTQSTTAATKVSINEKNTLLAQGLHHLHDPHVTMRIDSRQILDPDSLWRRKNFTKLSCGYVDQLGRFESDIQPEPGKKESKLSRTLKKFVNKEEDKAKEDLAYKVAEMIIKDVTKVTLGDAGKHPLMSVPNASLVSAPNCTKWEKNAKVPNSSLR